MARRDSERRERRRAEGISNERPSAKRELIQRTALCSSAFRPIPLSNLSHAHAHARAHASEPPSSLVNLPSPRHEGLQEKRGEQRERERGTGMTDARGSWQRAWNDTKKKKEKEEKMPRDRGRCSRGNAGGGIPHWTNGGHRKGGTERSSGPTTRPNTGSRNPGLLPVFREHVFFLARQKKRKKKGKNKKRKKKLRTQFSKGKIASVARPFRR